MHSEQINEIAAALAKAQGQMTNAKFNKQNPHFRSRYADLASIIDAIKQPLADNGLSYSQMTLVGETSLMLITKLLHSSGQWIDSEYPLLLAPDKPQVMGAAQTYARRYSLAAICGIAAEEDTDAEGVAEAVGVRKPPKPKDDIIEPPLPKSGVNAPPHDPQTGEVASKPPPPPPAKPEIDIQDQARLAAERGHEVFRPWYLERSVKEKARIDAIGEELRDLMNAYAEVGDTYQEEGS